MVDHNTGCCGTRTVNDWDSRLLEDENCFSVRVPSLIAKSPRLKL